MEKIKCKTCGNLFEPKNANDKYCSALCGKAGCFLNGGGDTSKPNPEGKPRKNIKPEEKKPRKIVSGEYPRVLKMLELPIDRRWEIAKMFTSEERAYAKRLARKHMMEERIVECISDWDHGEEREEYCECCSSEMIGESDDGSV